MQKVKLLVDHCDADLRYKAGSVIEVDPLTATWLVKQGHGELTQTTGKPSKPEPKEDK